MKNTKIVSTEILRVFVMAYFYNLVDSGFIQEGEANIIMEHSDCLSSYEKNKILQIVLSDSHLSPSSKRIILSQEKLDELIAALKK